MDAPTIDLGSDEEDVLAPSKTFVAKAIPTDDGYLAQFSAPGLIPRYVTYAHNNEAVVYPSQDAAEDAAREATFAILNKPRKGHKRGKQEKYQKLSGPDFAVLLAESGVGLSLFAYLYGSSIDRVQGWIDGLDNAPHPARVLLEIFKADPRMIDIAEVITDSCTTDRSGKR